MVKFKEEKIGRAWNMAGEMRMRTKCVPESWKGRNYLEDANGRIKLHLTLQSIAWTRSVTVSMAGSSEHIITILVHTTLHVSWLAERLLATQGLCSMQFTVHQIARHTIWEQPLTKWRHMRSVDMTYSEQRQFLESDVNQLITVWGNPEQTTSEVIMNQIKTVIKIACVE